MDLYFKRHDGQAVTCEDFYAAMRDANGADFANFLLWYVLFCLLVLFATVSSHCLGLPVVAFPKRNLLYII